MVQLNPLTSHLSNFVSFLKDNFDHICVPITINLLRSESRQDCIRGVVYSVLAYAD